MFCTLLRTPISTQRCSIQRIAPCFDCFVANSESAGDAFWFEHQNACVWKTNKNQDSYHLRMESHNLAALISWNCLGARFTGGLKSNFWIARTQRATKRKHLKPTNDLMWQADRVQNVDAHGPRRYRCESGWASEKLTKSELCCHNLSALSCIFSMANLLDFRALTQSSIQWASV